MKSAWLNSGEIPKIHLVNDRIETDSIMRKQLLLLASCLLAFTWATSQVTYDNFENERRVYYDFVHGNLDQFSANPSATGANTSEVCGKYIRNSAEQYDVLVILPGGLMNDVSSYLSGTKTMSVMVYSPAAGIPVQITLEDSAAAGPTNYPTGRHSVYLATTTVANQWETITFAFDNRPDASVSNTAVTSLILLFNPGTNTNATYYFDNLMGPEFNDPCAGVVQSPLTEFEDFDCHRNLFYEYRQGWLNEEPNPVTTGANTSPYAGKYTRNPDISGTDVIVSRFASTLDLTTDNQVKMMVYGDTANVVLSLQDGTNEVLAVTARITTPNVWQELTFDFSPATNYVGIDHAVILFDPGSLDFDIFWFDNFRLNGIELVGTDDAQVATLAHAGIAPNPSNGLVKLDFSLRKSADVQWTICDLQGRKLLAAQAGRLGAGSHMLPVDGSALAPGVYLWTLQVDGSQQTGKLVITQ
jgi:Secretion system C-terminal sorting domain